MIILYNVTCVKSSNNSYSIVQYYIYYFSLKQLTLSVRHILPPRLAVVINPSHYKVEAQLLCKMCSNNSYQSKSTPLYNYHI